MVREINYNNKYNIRPIVFTYLIVVCVEDFLAGNRILCLTWRGVVYRTLVGQNCLCLTF